MSIGQLDSQERVDEDVHADWMDSARASQVPKRHSTHSSPTRVPRDATVSKAPRSSWWKKAVSMLRNACIGVALISSIPFAVIAARGDALWFDRGNVKERIDDAEQMRLFALPVNPAVTVAQAGAALHALLVMPTSDEFPTLPHTMPLERGWQSAPSADETTPTSGLAALPDPKGLILRAHEGLSEAELAQLRTIAESPLWSAVNLVATASQVDFIGSQFILPFTPNAWAPSMPIHRMSGTREIANAGVARAAYYVAIKDFNRAEQALRSVVSYGFAFIDNGWSVIDGLLGRVMIGTARNGLAELAQVTGATSLSAVPELKTWRASPTPSSTPLPSAAEIRAQQFRDATDPSLPRPLRYESLGRLALGSCGDLRWVITGSSPEVSAAFDDARSTLARFPAERAYLELLHRTPDDIPDEASPVRDLSKRLLMGAATVAGTALRNPRVESCTAVLMAFQRVDR